MLKHACYRLVTVLTTLCLLEMCGAVREGRAQVDYSAPVNVRRFADYLYEEKDYLRAATEYQRCVVALGPLAAGVDSVYYRIGICYRLGERTSQSINYFLKIIDEFPQSSLVDPSYWQVAYTMLLCGRYEESLRFARASHGLVSSRTEKTKLEATIALNYICQKQWDTAYRFITSLGQEAGRDTLTTCLLNVAEEGQRLPLKSPVVAGVLSALIPGLGKAYCGRTRDGLFSLAVTGFTGWQAQRAFARHGADSLEGWIYGFLSGGLYLADIHGSVVAVRMRNASLEGSLLERGTYLVAIHFR